MENHSIMCKYENTAAHVPPLVSQDTLSIHIHMLESFAKNIYMETYVKDQFFVCAKSPILGHFFLDSWGYYWGCVWKIEIFLDQYYSKLPNWWFIHDLII